MMQALRAFAFDKNQRVAGLSGAAEVEMIPLLMRLKSGSFVEGPPIFKIRNLKYMNIFMLKCQK